jgi:hypothetical protein
MKDNSQNIALFLIINITLACGLLIILKYFHELQEGFEVSGLESSYTILQSDLKRVLGPYCALTAFIQGQMRTMYKSSKIETDQTVIPPPPPPEIPTEPPKPSPPTGFWGDNAAVRAKAKEAVAANKAAEKGKVVSTTTDTSTQVPGDTDEETNQKIKRAYEDAYACRDELADSRQSCAGLAKMGQLAVKMSFIPCSVYMNTPFYDPNDTVSMSIALSEIPDNLAIRIMKECDWYMSIIKKLQDGIDAGATPPTTFPKDSPSVKSGYTPSDPLAKPGDKAMANPPSTNSPPADLPKYQLTPPLKVVEGFSGWSPINEGFAAQCSPEAMRLKRERDRKRRMDSESDSCTIPDLQSQINRINRILNSKDLQNAIAACETVAAAGQKLQSQLELLKAGNLYDWQKSGPSPSYAKFDKKGDRVAGLTFSLEQNRG